jgi:deoxycytidine triphosphate deaminase
MNALQQPAIDLGAFAQDDPDAEKRFRRWKDQDPFPTIQSALLNTRDVLDYIAATGMIFPFRPDLNDLSRSLKPASCAIPIGGLTVWWEDAGQDKAPIERSIDLGQDGDEVVVKENSIVYVTLEPLFRLPDYIAARFNLKIQSVYRGLLVGTGPLVDPGFVGRLSVPLHNLTSNPYTYRYGDPLVWMEFTKLSPLDEWRRSRLRRTPRRGVGAYVEFPIRKRSNRTVRDYLRHAHEGPIVSSIPVVVGRAQKAAEAARKSAGRFLGVSLIAGLGVLIAVAGIVIASWQLVKSIDSDVSDVRNQVTQLRSQQSNGDVQRRLAKVEQRLRRICSGQPRPRGC